MKLVNPYDIKHTIRKNNMRNIVIETGEENIFVKKENKFIVTKDFLKHCPYLFSRCYWLQKIDLTNVDFSEIETMRGWFANNLYLTQILFPQKSNCFKLQSLNRCFYDTKIKNIDLSFMRFKKNKVNLGYCFNLMQEVETVILPKCMSLDMTSIFSNCYNLSKVVMPVTVKRFQEFDEPLYKAFYLANNLKFVDFSDNFSKDPKNLFVQNKFNLSFIPSDCVVVLPNIPS